MTTFINTYSFMDLLKDYNYVPETDHGSNEFLASTQRVYVGLTDLAKTQDYDFMDLLKDNNQVPEIAEQESAIMLEIEKGLRSIVDFFEESTTDYNFMTLLKDKGYVPSTVVPLPIAGNDNDVILREAS